MLYDSRVTSIHCPRCKGFLEFHVTTGALGMMKTREFCPKCKYSTEWQAVHASKLPGAN